VIVHDSGQVHGHLNFSLDEGPIDDEFRGLRQASTCRFISSKSAASGSTPTVRMSTRLKCFVCLASTGVNTPETMLPSWNGQRLADARAGESRKSV
jgi:hypothetical protein